ncbi:MAG: transcription-repair coupling factor [bacterium]
MNLLDTFRQHGAIRRALRAVENAPKDIVVAGAQGAALLLFCLSIAEDFKGSLLTILPDDDRLNLFEREMRRLLELEGLSANWELIPFPDYDLCELNNTAAVRERRRKRLSALSALYNGGNRENKWVLSTAGGASRKTMPPDLFRSLSLRLKQGDSISMSQIEDSLMLSGYERKKTVEHEGEYCIRGGMIDIYPSQADFPVRVELAGNSIEEMRSFDAETQRSSSKVPELLACPCFEASVRDASGDLSELRKDFRALVERGVNFDGAIVYPDVFGASANPLRDGWFDFRIVVNKQQCDEVRARLDSEAAGWLERNDYPDAQKLAGNLHIHLKEETLSGMRTAALNPLLSPDDEDETAIPATLLPPLPLNLTAVAERLKKETERGAVFVISKYKKRLERFLEDEGIASVQTLEGDLQGGFTLGDGDLSVFTDSEMFRRQPPQKTARDRRPKDGIPILAPEDIREGDYVVHIDHGIGIYDGMIQQKTGEGAAKDFYRIKYARGDTLFVPVEQLDRIEKYIGGENSLPKVYPLHSARWGKVKQKVRKKVEDLAAFLYKLYEERERIQGYAFSGDNIFMHELSESFPFEETEDQKQSIQEVIEDMQRARPMDRLVYGDVGFGKTEIAVRAAFKAALDRKQVALLAPTTILAHQHGETFRERLSRFPVTVEVISRFKSAKEQKEIVKRLAAGDIDIIIGTHRLLSKDVVFKNLGLLIIDEEQRFGVKHKEALKSIKTAVDVLTLTATPIPRTLNMSMIGLRDISLIETPPEERKSVITFVEEWNTNSLFVALERELARGGQAYFVHNDIASIDKIKSFLENAFPRARVAVCHGQMDEKTIEQTMIGFMDNEFDILVSTTIIENGLDIPNVNTLIVQSAENFGLAQLYQLRGRVGRSYRQSYAYLFHGPEQFLSERSRKRLDAIRDFAELGSGYRLALKDLEIRGAGNILSGEQSGYITEVGFNMYTTMLAESVERIKGVPMRARKQVEVELNADSNIPGDYIEDELRRTTFYKRITGASDPDKIEEIAAEMQDRYGPAPAPLKNFIMQAKLRLFAADVNITKIKTHPHSSLTDIFFESEYAYDRFRTAPYPSSFSLEAVYLKDRVRIMHENVRVARVVRDILDYVELAAAMFRDAFPEDAV